MSTGNHGMHKRRICRKGQISELFFRHFVKGPFSGNRFQDLFDLDGLVENLAGEPADFLLPFRLALPESIEDDNWSLAIFKTPLLEFRKQCGDRTFQVDDKKGNTIIVPLKSKFFNRLSCNDPVLILQKN